LERGSALPRRIKVSGSALPTQHSLPTGHSPAPSHPASGGEGQIPEDPFPVAGPVAGGHI
jgi:hypothetical protein